MTDVLLETQLLVVIFVLLLAVLGKLHAPKGRAQVLYIAIEGTLCALLLVSAHPLARLATSMLMVSATWVLGEMRATRPGQGCGCFGVLSSSPINRLTILRTGLLAAASIAAFPVRRTGLEVLTDLPGWHAVLFAAELGLIAALSPETSMLLRRDRIPCERRPVPLRDTLAALHASEAWRSSGLSREVDPEEVWREHCWRFVVYPAYLARPAARGVVVFAVSLADGEVRTALVEDQEIFSVPARRRAFFVPV